MHRTASLLGFALLAACASRESVSETEARFNAIAQERQSSEKFPVLAPLPSEEEVVDGGIPAETAGEIRSAASDIAALTRNVGTGPSPLATDATVAELKALIAYVRTQTAITQPPVDIEALDFPTPPPAE